MSMFVHNKRSVSQWPAFTDHLCPHLLGLDVRARAAVRPNICRALRPHARHSSSAVDLCINRDPRSLRSRCRYIAYPRAGEGRLLEVESFNSWDTSLKAMIDHMIVIRKFEIDLSNMSSLNAWQTCGMFVYMFIYVICLVLVLQLMYRFLNATLTSKFNSIQKESTLQWRLNFARLVLRSEFIWVFWNTAVGDGPKMLYQFNDVAK
jgi:hypothetical protein